MPNVVKEFSEEDLLWFGGQIIAILGLEDNKVAVRNAYREFLLFKKLHKNGSALWDVLNNEETIKAKKEAVTELEAMKRRLEIEKEKQKYEADKYKAIWTKEFKDWPKFNDWGF